MGRAGGVPDRSSGCLHRSRAARLGRSGIARGDQPIRDLGVAGGDLARTLRRRRPPPSRRSAKVTVDVDAVDARRRRTNWVVAHVVVRRSWWRGEIVMAMNAQFFGQYDVAPRGHPNDGKRRRRRASTRRCGCANGCRLVDELRTGTHLPHPASRRRSRFATSTWRSITPMVVWLDGVRCGSARRIRVDVRARRLHRLRLSSREWQSATPRVWSKPWKHGSSTNLPAPTAGATIDLPELGRGRRRASGRRQRAEPHGPVGHPGLPEAAAAARARLRRRRASSTAVGSAVTHGRRRRRGGRQPGRVAGRRHRGAGATTARWARLHDLRRALLGRPRRRTPIAPERNVVAPPAAARWEECAAYPAGLPHRVPDAASSAPAGRATRCSSSASASGVSCAALALGTHMGARVVVTSRSEAKRAQALEMGAAAAHDSRRAEVVGAGRRRGRERRPGDVGAVGAVAEARRPAGRVRRHVGPKVELNAAAAVLQAVRDHRLDDGQLPGVRRGDDAGRAGLAGHRRPVVPAGGLRGRVGPPRAGRAARQDRAARTEDRR